MTGNTSEARQIAKQGIQWSALFCRMLSSEVYKGVAINVQRLKAIDKQSLGPFLSLFKSHF